VSQGAVNDVGRSSIDDFLGDSSTRYFGAGFRHVSHRIHDVRVDSAARAATALVDVRYPTAWSRKRNRELQPHLSSIDALTVAADLADLHLRCAYGFDANGAARCWLRGCVLKAASTPTTDLRRVPVSSSLERTDADPDSLCGHVSHLTCRVGSIAVDLVVDHPVVEPGSGTVTFAHIDEALGRGDCRHYGEGYKRVSIRIGDIRSDEAGRIDAEIDFRPSGVWLPDGLSADYEPFMSMAHAIVGGAQLAQVVLYKYDQITRERSNNLWMRKIAMRMPKPVALDGPFRGQTWITKTNIIPMKSAQWRSASFVLTFPGLEVDYNLAHELLPSAGMVAPAPRAAGDGE
jgi:hypothetical protein